MKVLNVLIACEESQVEVSQWREAGYRAFSCDTQPCRRKGHPEWHIWGDVTRFLFGDTKFQTMDGKLHRVAKWHLIIAHPPCTYLCKVGSPHMHKNADFSVRLNGVTKLVNRERYFNMLRARDFFLICMNAQADFVAVENPLPMALANLPQPDCFVCPSWYGHKYTKKTLYWLRNLPPLMPEIINPNTKSFVQSSRSKWRSTTFAGVAKACVKQWGEYMQEYYSNLNPTQE